MDGTHHLIIVGGGGEEAAVEEGQWFCGGEATDDGDLCVVGEGESPNRIREPEDGLGVDTDQGGSRLLGPGVGIDEVGESAVDGTNSSRAAGPTKHAVACVGGWSETDHPFHPRKGFDAVDGGGGEVGAAFGVGDDDAARTGVVDAGQDLLFGLDGLAGGTQDHAGYGAGQQQRDDGGGGL